MSNSVDANARNIDIKLVSTAGGDEWTVIIQDDGNGMEERHMKAFFNAGQTEKDFPQSVTIGEKGLGSKTTFVAGEIAVESRRFTNPSDLLVGYMEEPMVALTAGNLPQYSIETNPPGFESNLPSHGTRVELSRVRLSTFNGKKTEDPEDIARRVLHYLRSMCATGTVKNRHAQRPHVIASVMNVGVIPMITVEVLSKSNVTLGPVAGAFEVPDVNITPSSGAVTEGIQENSREFCDVYDFSRSRTLSMQGSVLTVQYDGTAIIAGEAVRAKMLEGELRQGWTQKSQMGLHLCKDFIPLRNDNSLSRQLLGGEYYYEFKVFLNCQYFQLNADRNVVTNIESDEIAWIWQDFFKNVWPTLEARARPYKQMVLEEELAIEAVRKTRASEELKVQYKALADLLVKKDGASVQFAKAPKKEADVSHLLAMMVQAGHWQDQLKPIASFGQYIDSSTDILVEDGAGEPLLVEVETQLSNLFKHKHPMNSYDVVVVWELGGMTNGAVRQAPWGKNAVSVPVTLLTTAQGGWQLKWGTNHKQVIVLSEIL